MIFRIILHRSNRSTNKEGDQKRKKSEKRRMNVILEIKQWSHDIIDDFNLKVVSDN